MSPSSSGSEVDRLRLLFFVRHAGYVRNFESLLRELGRRGHAVKIVFDSRHPAWLQARDPLAEVVADYPAISAIDAPRRSSQLKRSARWIRYALDFLRYLRPEYRDAPLLRARAARRAPRAIVGLATTPVVGSLLRRPLAAALRLCEASLPPEPAIDELLRAERPDAILVTPLVGLGSPQADYVWRAHALGIPSALAVASWDNLTNKGEIRAPIDVVIVWNEAQRREAIQFHGIRPEAVVATGAHSYDHWFRWSPSTTRAEFCARVGLRDDRPMIAYVCSSLFVGGSDEAEFVLAWSRSLRATDRTLASSQILVRPHPQNAAQWADVELSSVGGISIFPREGRDPIDLDSRADFFDSLYHSSAVVGLNTSALIETAIIGRPVFTILVPRFRDTQQGTLHFAHLTSGEDPLLRVARSLDEHVAQLEAALAGEQARNGRPGESFLRSFIRPHGLEHEAAPLLADAIELAAQRQKVPAKAGSTAVRAALAVALWIHGTDVRLGLRRLIGRTRRGISTWARERMTGSSRR